MKKLLLLLGCLVAQSQLMAQNPICPIGTYVADPTARVWDDGRLYVYGSTDVSFDHWCSYKHDVIYTSDLKTWRMQPDVFTTKGENDQVEGTDDLLFAPDIMYRDGTYFLYFCSPDRDFSEGVATSKSPLGPFVDGQKLDVFGHEQIDPTIFIDDDGQAYYYWGQYSMKGAKMKPNMKELEPGTYHDGLLKQKEHFFHEGSFVFKRNGTYYVIYAHEGRHGGRPTSLGYATSDSPLGPFEYRGVVVDNYGCDPASWNNHGSVAEYNGQWYVFYHRSSHGSSLMRRACMEPIEFNADGSIDEVEMTSQGAGAPLNAFEMIDAERACLLEGKAHIAIIYHGNEAVRNIHNKDGIYYKYLNFNKKPSKFEAAISANAGGKINIRLGGPEGDLIGTLEVAPSDVKGRFVNYSCEVKGQKGVHALYFECLGEGDDTLFEIDEFKFY